MLEKLKRYWYAFRCRFITKPWKISFNRWEIPDWEPFIVEHIFQSLEKWLNDPWTTTIDWKHEHASKIKVNDKNKVIYDEVRDLCSEYRNMLKDYEEVENILWKEAYKYYPTYNHIPITLGERKVYKLETIYKSEECEQIHKLCFKALPNLEQKYIDELQKKLHRAVNVLPYL